MRSRIFFIAILGFWVVMNYLLWKSISSTRSEIGSSIPPEIVWDKILTAPDPSSLDIYDHEKKIGIVQWKATVGNVSQAMEHTLSDDYEPEGSIPQPSGYSLNVDGNTSIFSSNRVGFELRLRFSTNESWQDFRLTAKMKPRMWDIHASVAAQKVTVKLSGENGTWQRTFRFAEFQHPEALLAEVGGFEVLGAAAAAGVSKDSMASAAALHWDAHEDWMQIGHSRVRVYRLETQLLGQRLNVFISRVGEILWVEAPNKVTLRNEAFNHF